MNNIELRITDTRTHLIPAPVMHTAEADSWSFREGIDKSRTEREKGTLFHLRDQGDVFVSLPRNIVSWHISECKRLRKPFVEISPANIPNIIAAHFELVQAKQQVFKEADPTPESIDTSDRTTSSETLQMEP